MRNGGQLPLSLIFLCKDEAADLKPFGFTRTIWSKRQNQDMAPLVATEVALVFSHGRLCDASSLVGGVSVMCQVVATGGEMGI